MKKNMALMLAGTMAITAVPFSVFAADASVSVATPATLNSNSSRSSSFFATNTSGSALTIANTTYDTKDGANGAGFDLVSSPVLTVKGVKVTAGQTAKLEVALTSEGADFVWGKKYDGGVTKFDEAITAEIVKNSTGLAGATVVASRSPINDNKLVITITGATGEFDLYIPVFGSVNSNKAPLMATVKDLNSYSNVVYKTATVATVKDSAQSGDTTTTVSDTFTGKNNLKFDLLVSENYAGTFGSGDTAGEDITTYTLSSGFEFKGYNTLPAYGTTWEEIPAARVAADYDLNGKVKVYVQQGGSANKIRMKYVYTASASKQASSVKVKDIEVVAKSATNYGTSCYLSGNADSKSALADFKSVLAGLYSDYAFTTGLATGEKVPTLPAGALAVNITDGKNIIEDDDDLFDDAEAATLIDEDFEEYHETATLKFSETIADSLIANRTMEFEFPEEIEVLGFEITYFDKMGVSTGNRIALNTIKHFQEEEANFKFDRNVLKLYNLDGDTNEKGAFNITFYVAAEANYTGDVDVVVTGDALGGVELDPVTVAKFAPAFAIETSINNIKAGVQATDATDIVIRETEVGTFKNGEVVYVSIDDKDTATLQNAIVISDADVAVTAGDLDIKNVKILKGGIQFEISGESTDKSEITISDVVISTAYGLPETTAYPFDILVNTDNDLNAESTNDKPNASIKYGSLRADYVNITGDNTSALNGATVAVTEGSTTYTVNGTAKTMDVAPFIDPATNSMMVPVRFIADGVGLTEDNGGLIWSAGNKTVVLRYGSKMIEFPVGANFYRENGVVIYNDNNAITQIVDGRTFVPFRTVGNSLGLPVSWDGTTRTATYN